MHDVLLQLLHSLAEFFKWNAHFFSDHPGTFCPSLHLTFRPTFALGPLSLQTSHDLVFVIFPLLILFLEPLFLYPLLVLLPWNLVLGGVGLRLSVGLQPWPQLVDYFWFLLLLRLIRIIPLIPLKRNIVDVDIFCTILPWKPLLSLKILPVLLLTCSFDVLYQFLFSDLQDRQFFLRLVFL